MIGKHHGCLIVQDVPELSFHVGIKVSDPFCWKYLFLCLEKFLNDGKILDGFIKISGLNAVNGQIRFPLLIVLHFNMPFLQKSFRKPAFITFACRKDMLEGAAGPILEIFSHIIFLVLESHCWHIKITLLRNWVLFFFLFCLPNKYFLKFLVQFQFINLLITKKINIYIYIFIK